LLFLFGFNQNNNAANIQSKTWKYNGNQVDFGILPKGEMRYLILGI